MPSSISRLRIGFAVLALVAVAVVAGFYLYARWEMRRALRNFPGKIGVNIQQTSQGFTLSKSEGGHTLFTIHASKATQFKQGGRAELHDVRIVLYGRRADRCDQIYGSDFEYDPATATVASQGVVEIDLGAASLKSAGAPAPQATPLKPKEGLNGPPSGVGNDTIHLRAEGMVFDQKTGVAESHGRVEFRLPQAQGTAQGASYDSKRNRLTLASDIDVQTGGRQPEHILARHGSITKEPRELTLESAQISGAGRTLQAGHAVAYLAADNALDRVDASGDVRLSDAGGLRLRAPKGELVFSSTDKASAGTALALPNAGSGSALESAWFGGGVDFESAPQAADGHAGEMRVLFAAERGSRGGRASGEAVAPRTIYASQGVVLRQAPREGSRNPQQLTMTSSAMTFALKPSDSASANPTSAKGGQKWGTFGGGAATMLSSAQTEGPGELTIRSAASAGEETVIDGRHFTAGFGEGGRLRTLHGEGAVQVVSRTPGQPDKVSTSDALLAEFSPTGGISSAVQEGNFRYREAQSSRSEPGGRRATAARASYSPSDEALTLAGSPRIVDGSMTVEADSIRLLRRSGESFATGNVKTTYSQLAAQPNGALLASGDPVHVTAHAMSVQQASASGVAHGVAHGAASYVAHYTGGARLWQGSNVVEAQTIDFDEKARTITAAGDERHPVTSIFLQGNSKAKPTLLLVTAPRLNYEDNARQAHYTGGVTVKGEDGTMTAGRADVFLSPAGGSASAAGHGGAQTSAAPGAVSQILGPSQLERIVASTRVVLEQKERRVEGEKLVYEASQGTYVMTGGEPTLSDPVNGTVRGDSLTFYSRDDRVVVEGGEGSRAITRTHISR